MVCQNAGRKWAGLSNSRGSVILTLKVTEATKMKDHDRSERAAVEEQHGWKQYGSNTLLGRQMEKKN